MTLSPSSPSFAVNPLVEIFAHEPRLRLTRGNKDVYHGLRAQVPSLVSLVDGKSAVEVAALDTLEAWDGSSALGAVSFIVQANPHRPPPQDKFGRIDIVIVPEASRGLGLGRLLLTCAALHLVQNHYTEMYSISCLAAHPAVSKTLESLSFVPNDRGSRNYVHEELRLEGLDLAALDATLSQEAELSLQRVKYGLRQRQNSATA